MPEGEILSGKAAWRPNLGRRADEPVYSIEIATEICRRVAEGESLKSICDEQAMPSRTSFYDWVDDNRDGLTDKYTRARERLMEHWSEQIVSIADDQAAEPNDRRVRVDTRKWLMSKLAYRKYGDKLIHSGDPDNPIQVLHKAAPVEVLTDAELAALDSFTQARLTTIDVTPTSVVIEPTGNETTRK